MRTDTVLYLEPNSIVRARQTAALRAAGVTVCEVRETAHLQTEMHRVPASVLLVGASVDTGEFAAVWTSRAPDATLPRPLLVGLTPPGAPTSLLAPLRPAALLSASLSFNAVACAVAGIARGGRTDNAPAPELDADPPAGTRENALHALWESEKRYRGIVENAAEGIWSLDQDRITTYVNTRMAEMLGHQPDQVIGRRASDFVFPEDRQRAQEHFTTCLAGRSVRFDFRLRRRDSGELFVSIAASPVFNQNGQVTGVVGLLTDVTTRELVENQLQILLEEQEAERVFLQTLLDNLPVAVAVLNARDYRYRFMNAAMQRIIGLDTSLVGRRLEDLFPELKKHSQGHYEEVVRTGRPVRLREFQPAMPGYEESFWDADYLPVLDEAGHVSAIILITREVTESVRARKREEDLRSEAEARARDAESGRRRLEEEVERRLALEEQLRRSNQDLLQFAYVISHDLQEPMRNVASFSRLLVQRYRNSFDEQGEEFLGHIRASAERMRLMIDDLLVYSRVAHDSSTEFGSISMNYVVSEAMANLERSITENQAEVTFDDLPEVRGEFGRLAQLLQNLIGNAIKYRSGEAPRVHISARLVDRKWLFSVADNGVGIEPRYSEQIFGVFRRLHGREYPGTGIGLAIARQIVERHGGRIWVESEGTGGSTFHFTLTPVDSASATGVGA